MKDSLLEEKCHWKYEDHYTILLEHCFLTQFWVAVSPARNTETSILCSPEGCAQTGTISENASSCHLCEGHAVFWMIYRRFVSKQEVAWSHVEGCWGSCWSSWVLLLALTACNARKVFSYFLQNWNPLIGFCLLVETQSKHLPKAPQAGNENLFNAFWNISNEVEALYWGFNNVCFKWGVGERKMQDCLELLSSSPAHNL